MTSYHDRITSDHRVMLGKPVIKNTRLTVALLLRKLAEGASSADLLVMYPYLEAADIQAVLEYAAAMVAYEAIIDSAA
ncbi:MAG: DUF433 domain-containing protein [Hymenobacter sp.]|nr:DUF433 domain-containing protein [Hymenobacter sp.]